MEYYSQEQRAFQKTIRDFFENEVNPHVDEWEKARIFPAHRIFKRCGELGMLGINYDEKYGGAGLDYWWTAAYCEATGYSCQCNGIPMAIMVQTDMCTPALHEFGSEELKQRWLVPSIKGEAVGAIGVSEPCAGSDVFAIQTSARRDGDFYVINGSKIFITNGTQADYITTLVKTDPSAGHHGFSLIVVPTTTPGFSVAKKLEKVGNHSSDTAELLFEDCRVPVANRIGDEGMGFIYQMKQFQKERMVASLSAAAAAQAMLERTLRYTKDRKIFGKPLAAKQHVQFTLAELQTEIEMLRQLNYHCVRMMVAGEESTRETSMAKLVAGRLARKVADWCVQFHGGYGYMDEFLVSRYWRDARLLSIGGGADEVMLQIIAKLDGYSDR
ncbi:MAG: acyl-CoA dehydrogenase family protein [Deltaproteobacteria bacterium]|nr:acyl-CoA dehydrogenase family protein [Deltaproteobacteria bacterium]MBI3391342.1 acyl-CoA dehydrogenase family protein [Deltaproteobacteria bacterium]